MSSQLFYSPPKALFFENSCKKAFGLHFIFVPISTGYVHFQDAHFLGATRPAMVFFRKGRNTARKAGFEVCEELLCPVSTQKRNSPSKQKLTNACISVIQALFSLNFL